MTITHRNDVVTQASRGPLVVRLCNWVGEVVLSVPALKRLETAGYHLHLYGKSWAPGLLEGFGWPVTVRRGGIPTAIDQLRGLRRTIAGDGTPPALLFTKSLSSALETRWAGFRPQGYAYDGRSWLLTRAHPMPATTHMARSYWHLVDCFLDETASPPATLDWRASVAQQAAASALLSQHRLRRSEFVLLCPFSGSDDTENRKVWPGYAALARACHSRGIAVVVCPGPGEEIAARSLLPNAVCLTGVDLGVYGALATLARCTVANDTGPGHLAAAAGARLISLYGPRSSRQWTPIGPAVTWLQNTETWPSPEQVEALMDETTGGAVAPRPEGGHA
jgi:heptosyltransferase-2